MIHATTHKWNVIEMYPTILPGERDVSDPGCHDNGIYLEYISRCHDDGLYLMLVAMTMGYIIYTPMFFFDLKC